MKTMQRFSDALAKFLLPISSKIAKNKTLRVLMNTFLSMSPFLIFGAFCLIFSKPLVSPTAFAEGTFWFNFFTSWGSFCTSYLGVLKDLFNLTLGSLALIISVGIGYNYAKDHDLSILHTVVVTFVSYLVVNSRPIEGGISTAHFSGAGLFTAIITSFIACTIFKKITQKGITVLKLPDTVPANLKQSIDNLVPIFSTLVLMGAFSSLFTLGLGKTFPEAFSSIATFVQFGFDNVFAACAYYMLGTATFWFGIHEEAVLSLFTPIMVANLNANQVALNAGTAVADLPYIVSMGFKSFVAIGGSGGTLGLVLCCMRSKSEELRAVGKVSIVPAMFGINEPIIFGLPIMLNPIFLLPFLIVPVVETFIAYFCFSAGLVNTPAFHIGTTNPEIFKQVISAADLRAIPLWFVLLGVQILIWKPFVNIYEKQKLEEERALSLETTDKKGLEA